MDVHVVLLRNTVQSVLVHSITLLQSCWLSLRIYKLAIATR